MTSFATLSKISRPRFWLYLAGPYLLGYTTGVTVLGELLQLKFWLCFLLFLIPANIFLYGVNDYFDRDTDAKNAKKTEKEYRLHRRDEQTLFRALGVSVVCFVVALFFVSASLRWLLIVFLALSWLYSAPPVRFKAKPVLDSLSNVLYIIPGVFGYYQVTGTFAPAVLLFGLWAWAAAMHLFSAVPDIVPDRAAGVATGATFLGARRALVLCTVYWLLFAAAIIYSTHFVWWSFLSILYPLIAAVHVPLSSERITKTYWYFPYLNAALGALCFFAIALPKL